jgi:hypothetical protein
MRRRRLKIRLFWVGLFCALLLIALAGIIVRPFAAVARWGAGLVECAS